MPKRAQRISVIADASNVVELRDKLESASFNKRFVLFVLISLSQSHNNKMHEK